MKTNLIILFTIMTLNANGKHWLDTSMYPYAAHYYNSSEGKVHYIDEGEGETILMIHGTPAWSFLYRHVIDSLKRDYRVIAPDHLGFGLSDKPVDFEGTPQAHANVLKELIEYLGLEDITLVVHDFGGPIGLGAVLDNPGNIKRVVLFNTWLWETESNKEVAKIDRMLRGWFGRFMYLNLNASPRFLMKSAYGDKKKLTRKIHRQYVKPFSTKKDRWSLLNLARSLRGSSDWYQEQSDKLARLSNIPIQIIWGMNDPFLTSEFLDRWKKLVPHAEVSELQCGHFVQEEMPAEAVEILKGFLAR